MAIKTVGDLLNLPQAFEARIQQKELESRHRAGEAVAKLFGETYNPYGLYGDYGYSMGYYTPDSRPRLTQHLSEIINPDELINKDD